MGNTKVTPTILAVVLVLQPIGLAAQTAAENASGIRERLAQIPIGTTIEVKLLKEGSKKVVGTLTSVTDESFEVCRDLSGGTVTDRIAFAEVKSVKSKSKSVNTGSGVKKALIWVGTVVLVAVLWTAIFCEHHKCY